MEMMKPVSVMALMAAYLVPVAPAVAQNATPLARGEVLLQLQQNVTLIEPLGSIVTDCVLSAHGENEAEALAALGKKRDALQAQMSNNNIPQSIVTEMSEPNVGREYADAASIAVAAAAAAASDYPDDAAVDAAAAIDAADDAYPSETGMVSRARQTYSFRFTSYAQFTKLVDVRDSIECAAAGYGSYGSRSGRFPIVEPADPVGASTRAWQKAVEEARVRADLYAASMGMKVVRLQRVSEVGELSAIIGPEFFDNFRRTMRTDKGEFDANILHEKVQVTEGLFVDFVLGAK